MAPSQSGRFKVNVVIVASYWQGTLAHKLLRGVQLNLGSNF